jgi:hypothetical protein
MYFNVHYCFWPTFLHRLSVELRYHLLVRVAFLIGSLERKSVDTLGVLARTRIGSRPNVGQDRCAESHSSGWRWGHATIHGASVDV